MQGMRKTACLLLLFLAISVSAGCSSSLKGTDYGNIADETGYAVTPVKAGFDLSSHVKITGYLLGSALPGTHGVMETLNSKLNTDLNAEMVINYISWGDVQSRFPLILAAGEDVDWVFTAPWAFYPQLAAKGAFLEITPELLEQYMPLHYAQLKDTDALKEAKIGGKVYMIPTSTPDRKSNVFIYREDLRKKYGMPEIKKFSDLEPYMEAIKENESGMIPLAIGSNYDLVQPHANIVIEQFDFVLDMLATSSGGSGVVYCPLDHDGKLYYIMEEPIISAYKKAAATIKSWHDKGYINKDAFANKVRSKEAFVQGKSAIGLGNSIDIQGNISQAIAEGYEVGLLPVLSGKSGEIIADSYIGNGMAISRNSKNPQRTLMAMDLIMQDKDYGMLVYFGIDGINYRIKDGKIELLGSSAGDSHSYPPDQAGFWFTNKDLFPPLASWIPSYTELNKEIKSRLASNIYASFAPSMDNIKTEMENCNQTIIQYLTPIEIGSFKDLDGSFDLLDSKLKAAGVERIMAELKKQTEAFLREQGY